MSTVGADPVFVREWVCQGNVLSIDIIGLQLTAAFAVVIYSKHMLKVFFVSEIFWLYDVYICTI